MKSRLSFILLLLILAIAVFFRFYNLDEFPPGLYPDVAVNGTDAVQALKTGDFKLYYPENNGREGLFMNLIALSFWLFGQSVLAIKVVPAMFGVLTVIGTYLLTKRLFSFLLFERRPKAVVENFTMENFSTPAADVGFRSKNNAKCYFGLTVNDAIALLSAFFLAISFWHVNFSRLGFRAIMVPFFLVWSLYLLIKAIRIYESHPNDPNTKNKLVAIGYWLVAGLFFGLGFHTYISFRVAPLILLPIFVFDIILHWPRPKIWRWLIFALGIIIAASPMIYYFYQNPGDFMGRATQVSVFESKDPVLTLAWSTIKTLGQFVVYGDPNQRHNISGSPQIFWPLIPFFIIGIIYIIRQIIKRKNYLDRDYSLLAICYMLFIWWSSMLLPSIFTNEGLPHALRSIGAIPPSYIFTGLGAFLLFKNLKLKIKNSAVLLILIFLFLTGLAAAEYYRYFIYWGQAKSTQSAFAKDLYDEGIYLKTLPKNVKKYVIINEGVADSCPDGIAVSTHTIKFLAPTDTKFIYPGCENFKELLSAPINNLMAILPQQRDENLLNLLKKSFPSNGTVKNFGNFSVFMIQPFFPEKQTIENRYRKERADGEKNPAVKNPNAPPPYPDIGSSSPNDIQNYDR